VRRRLENLRALRRSRVAGTNGGRDLRRVDAERLGELLDAAARNREVLVNVRAQRLERRDVDDARLVRQRAAEAFLKKIVEAGKKGRQGLARSGRRRDERVASRLNFAPAALLRARRRAERLFKPACDDRMKGGNVRSLP